MELAPGGSIAERLPLPMRRAIGVALELCGALAHAHAHGVVHRDIKPANVLIDAKGRAKLTDFGIARLFDAPEDSLTGTSRVLGTPAYMAPGSAARSEAGSAPRRGRRLGHHAPV